MAPKPTCSVSLVDDHVELRVRLPTAVSARSEVFSEMQPLVGHECETGIGLSTASVLSWVLKTLVHDCVETFDLDVSALEVRMGPLVPGARSV
jgi:hypothetical protein